MINASLLRRIADALVSLMTWAAAAGAVLWFYDWVNRWYVVVGVLLVLVGGAIVVDRLRDHEGFLRYSDENPS